MEIRPMNPVHVGHALWSPVFHPKIPKPTSSKFTFAVKDPPKFDRSYWGTCSWSRAFHRISCIFQQHQLRHMDPWCDNEVHWWGLSSIPSPVPVLWPLFGSARILRPATHAGCASFKGSSKRRKARQRRLLRDTYNSYNTHNGLQHYIITWYI